MDNLTGIAPPEDASEGWKSDPLGTSDWRWWDGSKWTERVGKSRPTPNSASPPTATTKNLWSQLKGWPAWAKIVVPIVAVLIVATALGSEEETNPESNPTGAVKTESAAETPPAETDGNTDAPPNLREIVENAKGLVEDPEIKAFYRGGDSLTVIAATPEGGFEGASTTDLGYQASGIFAAVYGEGAFKGNTTIKFSGGLVDSRTGQELPDALTGEFKMTKVRARQIDWTDQDAIDYGIDWSLYRTFVHPAIKVDD